MFSGKKNIFSVANIAICIILTIGIGTLIQQLFNMFHNSFTDILTIKQKDVATLVNTIWQVQAGITTLTIALLSLLIGLSKERRYGIRVLDFMLFGSRKFLKFQDHVLFGLSLVSIQYVFVAYESLAAVVFIFFINMAAIISMFHMSVKVLFFEDIVDEEIKEYVLNEFLVMIREEEASNGE
ncbi:hypothetical protein [Bacillus cereus]|uniref:hypothetical protein n=1 Tax=Bacillus cereus TaxID=1396 RepID=UPI002AC1F9F8|nr:hypothetical protein [Bacillus cereus]MDZ4567250.1 hypothetical protein [Bacillus cereus]